MSDEKIIEFKFKFVKDGQTKGYKSKFGYVSENYINLDDDKIEYNLIVDTAIREKRLAIVFLDTQSFDEKTKKFLIENYTLAMEIQDAEADELKRFIDIKASKIYAEKNKARLEKEGKIDLFKTVNCPNCTAIVDLSELNESTYTYCDFCNSIFAETTKIISNGDDYGTCSECHMYGKIQGYTVFHFYFLLLIYGYRHEKRYLCNTCALKVAKKTLLTNLLFLLGIPSALSMWIKARKKIDPEYLPLIQANRKGSDGKFRESDPLYEKIMIKFPDHPGILYNQARAHLIGRDSEQGIHYLKKSLDACSNYYPSIKLVRSLQRR
ncbi:MAG: hypothetical protein ACXAC7_05850 [Candidatus Hodarchaeales archaeon]|jgi:hypothetical protein